MVGPGVIGQSHRIYGERSGPTAMVGHELPVACAVRLRLPMCARRCRHYQIAKCQICENCLTSMKMIENDYSAHFEARLDASAISIMRLYPKQRLLPRKAPSSGSHTLGGRSVDLRSVLYDGAVVLIMRAWRNGRRSGLKRLSAHRETDGVELLKVGETLNGNPEPSPESLPGRCRD